MKTSVDISLYPLADEYIPAIKEFIERVQKYPDVSVVRNDLSTQLYGDYDQVMDLLKVELRLSWEKYGKSIFVIKFLNGDLRAYRVIELLAMVAEQLLQNSVLELVAVVFAIAYLVLAVKESSLCWYAAGISTLIFLFIFWDVKLYMESGLQIYTSGWLLRLASVAGRTRRGYESSGFEMERGAACESVGAHCCSNFCIGLAFKFRNRCEHALFGFVYNVGECSDNLHGRAQNTGKLDLLACYRFRIDLSVYRSRTLFHSLAVRDLYCHYFLRLDGVE
jgi:hypothetical protein